LLCVDLSRFTVCNVAGAWENLMVAEISEEGGRVLMRMYVASDSAPSVQARRQLGVLRERFGGEDWEVEVVDVFEQSALAEADRILATPVLIRLFPSRRLSVIGDFADLHAVASALELEQEVAR
jgi:circadian clock protein KaiB